MGDRQEEMKREIKRSVGGLRERGTMKDNEGGNVGEGGREEEGKEVENSFNLFLNYREGMGARRR